MNVTAIYHRPRPIYHAAYVGKPPNETATVWREIEEAKALRVLQERFPIVKGLHRPPQIGRDFWCVISVDSERAKPGMIGNLLLGAARAAEQLNRRDLSESYYEQLAESWADAENGHSFVEEVRNRF